jgi:hypothetical protein
MRNEISYRPKLATIFGSVNAALLYGLLEREFSNTNNEQFLLTDKHDDDKGIPSIYHLLGCTKPQIRNARTIICNLQINGLVKTDEPSMFRDKPYAMITSLNSDVVIYVRNNKLCDKINKIV